MIANCSQKIIGVSVDGSNDSFKIGVATLVYSYSYCNLLDIWSKLQIFCILPAIRAGFNTSNFYCYFARLIEKCQIILNVDCDHLEKNEMSTIDPMVYYKSNISELQTSLGTTALLQGIQILTLLKRLKRMKGLVKIGSHQLYHSLTITSGYKGLLQ